MRAGASLTTLILVVALTGLAGCISDPAPTTDGTDADAALLEDPVAGPHIIEWNGHITHQLLDPLAHMKDPETVIYPIQQAGFLVDIEEVPTAIEVMVSWEDPNGAFRLHPHYTAENDPALGGDTLYYGYPSDMFETSPGCIRIPAADMAAGSWPMMIHPGSGVMDVDYTITVGIQGAEGTVPDKMHGHRSDGASPVDNRDVEPCQFLLPAEDAEPAADTPA